MGEEKMEMLMCMFELIIDQRFMGQSVVVNVLDYDCH
jgi:hypothetical protein